VRVLDGDRSIELRCDVEVWMRSDLKNSEGGAAEYTSYT